LQFAFITLYRKDCSFGLPGLAVADKADLKALVEGVTARSGFTSYIGARVVAVERGLVQLSIDRRPDLLQFNGHFHGGVIAALADHAAGGAVTTALPAGKIAVTIDMHVNYLAPAAGKALLAKAKAIRVGSSVAVAHVDVMTVTDGAERTCAVALVTLRAVNVDSRKETPSA
jgi:uncharacterized protein (TIGR00369 family)